MVAKLVSVPPAALIDVAHARAARLLGDGLLRLSLGPDEENVSALRRHLLDEHERVAEELHRLLEVDDVNAVARPEDVLLHLGVPTAGLVAEVGAGLEQLFQRNGNQERPPSLL
jgi:hypothetical protein